jgi:hypothetical protein
MKNIRLFLKALIVLLFLYSRFTYYADAYPKTSTTESLMHKFITSLRNSADFVKSFGDMSFIPHERTNIQKLQDFILNMPALGSIVEEARHIYKDDLPQFWNELYTRLFSKSTIINVARHVTLKSLIYDTLMLSVLLYFVYKDHYLSNVVLIGDSIYKFITLLIYHFRETPMERLSNFFLSFFTNLKTMNIFSMFRTNYDALVDHRSVIATFIYMGLLIGYFLWSKGMTMMPKIMEDKVRPSTEPSRISQTVETKRQ